MKNQRIGKATMRSLKARLKADAAKVPKDAPKAETAPKAPLAPSPKVKYNMWGTGVPAVPAKGLPVCKRKRFKQG